MTKTKKQLRAEAVERLTRLDADGYLVVPILEALCGYYPSNPYEQRNIIANLLTDDEELVFADGCRDPEVTGGWPDEPPEGDAVAILRKAASYDGDYSSSGEALRRLTDRTTVYYALEALADMVEHGYVSMGEHERIVQGMVDANTRQCERANQLEAERDAARGRIVELEAERLELLELAGAVLKTILESREEG